ncbi:MAG TPA: flippase [Candidatus Nanoarchaeia archaeon]|nr:flippase [Candidatus Nanoarchaeia archaeon]
MTNYAKKTLIGTVYIFAISLLAALVGYTIRIVLTRGLTKEGYGLFYAVLAFFGLLVIFKDFGLNQALVKFVSDYIHKKDYSGIKSVIISVFSIQMTLSAALCLIMILLSDIIARYFFHAESASLIIKFLALMFLLMPVENLLVYSFQAFQRMFLYASVSLLKMLTILVLVLVFLKVGMDVLAPSVAYFLAYIIVPLILIPFFFKTFPQFFEARFHMPRKTLKRILGFGLTLLVGVLGGVIMLNTDTVVLTYFGGVEEVALYQVASPTASIVLYFAYAVSGVLLPLAAELWLKGRKQKLKTAMELIYKYSFIIVVPIALLMLLFPKLILTILFTAEYADAAPAMQILVVGMIFYTLGHINLNVLTGIGKPIEGTKIVVYAALFNLVTNLLLIPRFGIVGAAFTTMLSWIIVLGLTSYKIKRYVNAHAPLWGWTKNFVAGMAFVAVISILKAWLDMNMWAELIISVGAASLVYAALVLAFRLVTKEDFNFMRYALGRGEAEVSNVQGQDNV